MIVRAADIVAPVGDATFALADDRWQMAPGERAAIEGLLSQIRPALAIEIGTAQGGSLARIAAHSQEVHSFDLDPDVDESRFPNVTFHRGDSHVLLPEFLRELEAQGRNVDFALVDGDHRAEGVRADVMHLVESSALRRGYVVMHDTMNEEVHEGLHAIDWAAFSKVRYVDLAFTQLYSSDTPLLHERWGGLGLIAIDDGGDYAARTGVLSRRQDWPLQTREIAWRTLRPARRLLRWLKHSVGAVVKRRGLRHRIPR
ncbi:MAG: hypothetical protein QOF37_114 [Thermoleophilaceae bacterium]|jgi:hypothetical protein|nr:hypothetical protein [Thermoleophilaceae bacterium]